MSDAFLTPATLTPAPCYLPRNRNEKEATEMIQHLFQRRAVFLHSCLVLLWRRKQGLTAFLPRPVRWGHLPYGRAPSTGWIWWLHSQSIVKGSVANAGHVILESGWGSAGLWIPICGPADSQNDHESGFAFRAHISISTVVSSSFQYALQSFILGPKG